MKIWPWLFSIALHLVLLFLVRVTEQQAAFAMDRGQDNIVVNLVAAASNSPPPAVPASRPVPIPPPLSPDPLPAPVVHSLARELEPLPATPPPTLTTTQTLTETQKLPMEAQPNVSNEPPKQAKDDPLTAQSVTPTGNPVSASYLRNPKPPYPIEALKRKQEGSLLLSVVVGSDGRPSSVRVVKSSGFPLLDEAAVTTVRSKWLFHPATVAGIPVQSTVIIPIRFNSPGP